MDKVTIVAGMVMVVLFAVLVFYVIPDIQKESEKRMSVFDLCKVDYCDVRNQSFYAVSSTASFAYQTRYCACVDDTGLVRRYEFIEEKGG